MRTTLAAVLALLFGFADAVRAQQAKPLPLAIDTSATIEEAVSSTGDLATGVVLDAVVTAGLGRGFEAIVRPFAQRLAATGEWNRQIWVGEIRYQRPGAIGLRIDAGLIPSPVGLANLSLRPHMVPTMSLPSSLFTSLPSLGVRAPRTTLLGIIYPFGAQVTASTTRWDARAAVIDTSPLRSRRIFAPVNPPRFLNTVVGGGITPVVGIRVGGSMTRGGWQRAGESPVATTDRSATIYTIESDVSFGYTKIIGEWVRDVIETSTGNRVATGWYLQGQQTLTPRWFVGGRAERMSSPLVFDPIVQQQHFNGVEEVVGFRVTPDITLRIGHRARRAFGRPGFDHQAAASLVWWRRWL